MRRLLFILGIALAAGLLPSPAFADDGDSRDGLVLRVKGDVTVAAGETVGSVVVINGDALIEGRVRNLVLVIRGDARVTGSVDGNVTMVDGDLALGRTARVKDVSLVRGDLTREAGSTVTGDVNRRGGIAFRGAAALFSIFLWAGMTVAVLAAGLVFAAVGGRQLAGAARLMTTEIGYSLLSTLVLWVGTPILAVLLILTVIGIPLGLGLLVFLLPALWFLGYLVSGTRLGAALVGLAGRESGEHPYLAAALGLLALQIVALVPVLGGLVLFLAGVWGAGTLALLALRAARGVAPGPGATAPAGEA